MPKPTMYNGCSGAVWSNRVSTMQIVPGTNTNNPFTPYAASFLVYNNTDVTIYIEQVPIATGGYICFEEMVQGCYDDPFYIKISDTYSSGAVDVIMIRKYAKNETNG